MKNIREFEFYEALYLEELPKEIFDIMSGSNQSLKDEVFIILSDIVSECYDVNKEPSDIKDLMKSKFTNMIMSLSKYKVLLRSDNDDEWEHIIIFIKKGYACYDKEDRKLDIKEVLEELSTLGLFDFTYQQIT